MAKDKILNLILTEVQGLRSEMTEVRTKDIPRLEVKITKFDEKVKTIKSQQTWATRIYTVVGGIIAVAVSKFMGHS